MTQDKFLTIFTPTYNRARTIPRLYESLLNQTLKDFEWLIVDDGSTDQTEELIQSYIQENRLNIRYYKQKNQGKHIAYNTSLQYVKTEFMVTLDSDDYYLEDAVSILYELSTEIKQKDDFGGFSYIHFSEGLKINTNNYGQKRFSDLTQYDWEQKGEMAYVFKSSIAKQFPFPVFVNEKFCQESVIFIPMMKKFKILYTDYVLARGEYMQDGLSQNLYRRMLKNPKYAMLSLKKKIEFSKDKSEKIQFSKMFWDIALKTQPKYKLISISTQIPIYYTLKILLPIFKSD